MSAPETIPMVKLFKVSFETGGKKDLSSMIFQISPEGVGEMMERR